MQSHPAMVALSAAEHHVASRAAREAIWGLHPSFFTSLIELRISVFSHPVDTPANDSKRKSRIAGGIAHSLSHAVGVLAAGQPALSIQVRTQHLLRLDMADAHVTSS